MAAATAAVTLPSLSLPPFRRARINLQPPQPDSTDVRTLPELVEFNAEHNPGHLFCLQALKKARDQPQETLAVTQLQLKRAVLQCSKWLVSNIHELRLPERTDGGEVVKGRPVALFMESDVGLIIHILSLLSLGIPVGTAVFRCRKGREAYSSKAVLLSARLSPTAINQLLMETSAAAIIASSRLCSVAKNAQSEFPQTEALPALYTQVPYETFLHYGTNNQAPDVPVGGPDHYVSDTDRNVLILHSSGTTGLPKPLYSSHRFLLGFAAAHEFSNDVDAQGLVVSTLPLYHVS